MTHKSAKAESPPPPQLGPGVSLEGGFRVVRRMPGAGTWLVERVNMPDSRYLLQAHPPSVAAASGHIPADCAFPVARTIRCPDGTESALYSFEEGQLLAELAGPLYPAQVRRLRAAHATLANKFRVARLPLAHGAHELVWFEKENILWRLPGAGAQPPSGRRWQDGLARLAGTLPAWRAAAEFQAEEPGSARELLLDRLSASEARAFGFDVGMAGSVGTMRVYDEDAFALAAKAGRLCVAVADGTGGWNEGAAASEAAVAAACVAFEAVQVSASTPPLEGLATYCANGGEAAVATRKAAASCLVVGVFGLRELRMAHVGDSRIYRFRGGRLTRLTTDRTLGQPRVDAGKLTLAEAETHPHHNVLPTLGQPSPTGEPAFDALHDVSRSGDRYLFCTDGLHTVVPDPQIAEVLARLATCRAAAAGLHAAAIARGTPDNVAIVVVGCR